MACYAPNNDLVWYFTRVFSDVPCISRTCKRLPPLLLISISRIGINGPVEIYPREFDDSPRNLSASYLLVRSFLSNGLISEG
jgi:hypothetical protein